MLSTKMVEQVIGEVAPIVLQRSMEGTPVADKQAGAELVNPTPFLVVGDQKVNALVKYLNHVKERAIEDIKDSLNAFIVTIIWVQKDTIRSLGTANRAN